MTIRLYNTKTRTKDEFVPINADDVRMYVCGPTVYDRAHIGNARPVVVFDVLYRLLRHEYGAEHVRYVRNFTDVDDKINAKAVEVQRNGETLVETVRRITDETIGWYHEDMDALGALRPDHEPRATEYIAQMIAMGEDLIARGHAYVAEGHVLFEARTDPEYGSLSRRPLDEMRAGARVEVAPYKRDPMDSVIWKPSTEDQPGWDSPWGRGRPGWHIECSAMAGDLLGEHFDIHGGGIDLQFPHHENECAQSRCVGHQFANVWMHNGYLQVEGEKMSKSLGNFFTVADLREKGVPGEVMRLAMLMTHYRSPIDWTEKAVGEENAILSRWYSILEGVEVEMIEPDSGFLAYLGSDLNTPGAINALHQIANTGDAILLKSSARLIGLLQDDPSKYTHEQFRVAGISNTAESFPYTEQIDRLLHRWQQYREEKNFASADLLKAKALAAGVELMATAEGPQADATKGTFDPAKLPEAEDD